MWKVSLLLLCVLCLARADDSSSSSSSSSSEENKNKASDEHSGKEDDGNAATEVEDTPPLMLTPYVHSKDFWKARELARVSPDIGNVVSYSGYLTVDFEKHCDRHLFFWFFPAEKDWEDAPVILWLQGGPGQSSMYGLFEMIGPFNSFADGLHLRETSWTNFANVIVIDNPAGAGFSFATKGCEPKSISTVAEDLHEAVEQIVKLFPELDDNGLFLAGESFAGHYIPPLGELIDKKNTKKEQIKLKGVVMGNPFLDIECHDYATFLFETGLIDENLRDEIEKVQKKMHEHVKEKKYLKAYEDWDHILGELVGKKAGLTSVYSILSEPEDKSTYIQLLQDQEVRNWIHAGTQEFVDFNATTYEDLAATIPESYVTELGKLLKTKQYIVAIYSGNLDIISMSTSSECVMRDLKWSGQNEYLKASRKIWYMDNEVVGWTKNVDNLLLDVLVKDAQHAAILSQPEVTYKMMESIVTAKPGQDPLRALNTR